MNKTIVIYIVFLTIYSYEATNSSELIREKCETPYNSFYFDDAYCGTDGRNYYYLSVLKCEQKTKYGKSINLQLKHRGRCWIWEKYGYETYEVICISLIIFAVIIGVYLYYTGGVWRRKKCTCALKNSPIDGPHDTNRFEKIIKVKINLHVETKDGISTFRHDPIIIDNVQFVLIPAASTITMDEKNQQNESHMISV